MFRRIMFSVAFLSLILSIGVIIPSQVMAEGGNYIGGQQYRPGDMMVTVEMIL